MSTENFRILWILTPFRGTHFTLSRDELLTLPEFVLLSLFPNGLLPDGHMGTFHEGDIYPVDVSEMTRFCPCLMYLAFCVLTRRPVRSGLTPVYAGLLSFCCPIDPIFVAVCLYLARPRHVIRFHARLCQRYAP